MFSSSVLSNTENQNIFLTQLTLFFFSLERR